MGNAAGQHSEALQLLHRQHVVLLSLQLRDVDRDGDVPEIPATDEPRCAGGEHGSILTVRAAQPKLDLKGALPLDGGENAGADCLGIIGMNQFQESFARELFLGSAREDQHLPVAERHSPAGVG